jgi:hypothetical protein
VGLLLDLDLWRLPPADSFGEAGPPAHPPSPEERARWSAARDILVLQYLRGRGIGLPALLFADLDDRDFKGGMKDGQGIYTSPFGRKYVGGRVTSGTASTTAPARFFS